MLRPQVPKKAFGGHSVGRKPRDELWAPVLRLVLYVVFGKASLMSSVPVVAPHQALDVQTVAYNRSA
jgi:hypothetical protein